MGGVLWLALMLAAPAKSAAAYGWPLKPFDQQHPIRGDLNDPRIGSAEGGAASERSFHFGVDIPAADATPVYAVSPGTVYVEAEHPQTVQIASPGKTHVFGYWHIDPVVRTGMQVGLHELVGHVASGWGHVHFAELVDGRYVNPLRRGGLAPYADETSPTIGEIEVTPAGGAGPMSLANLHGTVGVAVEASDAPPLPPPAPWQATRLPPARVSWRMSGPVGVVVPQIEVANLAVERLTTPLEGVYAPGTRQNRASRPGDYWFWLDRQLDTSSLPDGRYVIRVTSWDIRGNVGGRTFVLDVLNHPQPPEIETLASTPSVIGPADDLSASVSFSVATNARAVASLLDATGRVVRALYDRQVRAGRISFRWATRDLPSGRYKLRLSAFAPRAPSRSATTTVVINRPFGELQVTRATATDAAPASVTIALSIIQPVMLTVTIVDESGAPVATVFDGPAQVGRQTFQWTPPAPADGAATPTYTVVVTATDALGPAQATAAVP